MARSGEDQELPALRQRLDDRQREFAKLQHAFTLVTAENEAMQQILRSMLQSPSLDSVLGHAVDLLMDLHKAEAGSLLLIDRDAPELYFRVARGPVGDKVKEFRVRLDEGIAGWVASENEPVAISDVQRDARFKRDISEKLGYEVRSILAVPFRLRGKVVGVFEILNKGGGDVFLAADRDATLLLATYLGQLLHLAGHERVE